MSIKATMYEEVQNQYEEISKMELGSEQCVKAMNAINGTVDRLNEMEKLEIEDRKLDIEEQKLEIERERNENEKKDRLIKTAVGVGTFVLGTAVTIWGYVDSKHFEQGYTHTTNAGRESTRSLLNIMNKFKF